MGTKKRIPHRRHGLRHHLLICIRLPSHYQSKHRPHILNQSQKKRPRPHRHFLSTRPLNQLSVLRLHHHPSPLPLGIDSSAFRVYSSWVQRLKSVDRELPLSTSPLYLGLCLLWYNPSLPSSPRTYLSASYHTIHSCNYASEPYTEDWTCLEQKFRRFFQLFCYLSVHHPTVEKTQKLDLMDNKMYKRLEQAHEIPLDNGSSYLRPRFVLFLLQSSGL